MSDQINPKPNLEAFQALAELDTKERNLKAQGNYMKAYVLSALLPPIGLFYFIKYVFFSDGDSEAIKAGIVSLIITIISLLLSIWFVAVFFKQASSSIPSEDINSLKELITPENQKKFKDLLQ